MSELTYQKLLSSWTKRQPSPKERTEEDTSFADTVKAIQYKEKDSLEDQMGTCKEVKTIDDNKLDTDWRENVNTDVHYAENPKEILDALA